MLYYEHFETDKAMLQIENLNKIYNNKKIVWLVQLLFRASALKKNVMVDLYCQVSLLPFETLPSFCPVKTAA